VTRPMLTELDHVGIAVVDLEAEVDRYRRAFGLEPVHRETVASQGVEEVLFAIGTSYVQLLRPLDDDTPVGRHLSKRGPGVHHVAYRVDDLAAALQRLRTEGVPLVDEVPRPGSRGTRIAFVHPRGIGGVLVELVQEPGPGGWRSERDRASGSPGEDPQPS
jgi:methylmalonyl-CoA/ethylmalonyl-CoA epimerase